MSLKFAVFQTSSIYDVKLEIPELKGDNYKVWKESPTPFRMYGYRLCIRKDEPLPLLTINTKADRVI